MHREKTYVWSISATIALDELRGPRFIAIARGWEVDGYCRKCNEEKPAHHPAIRVASGVSANLIGFHINAIVCRKSWG